MDKTIILLKNVGIADLTFGSDDFFLKLLKTIGLHVEYTKVDDHKVEITLWTKDGRCFSILKEQYYISDKMTHEKIVSTCQEYIKAFTDAIRAYVNSKKKED